LTLILGLVLTGCLLTNVGQVPTTGQSGISYLTKAVEGDPFVTTLFAGQDNPVGTVSVWNDAVELHVTYNTTSPWVMTETHLAVVTDPALVPMTKTGNPKVGKFLYGAEDLIEFDLDGNIIGPYIYSETILLSELGVTHDDILYIAAHAVVVDISSIITETMISEVGVDVYGPLDHYASLESTDWGSLKSAVDAWVHPSWPWQTGLDGATWISTAYNTEGPVLDSWRWFHDEIDLPEKGYYLSASVVLATSDNAEEVYFNEMLVGSDGEVQGPFVDDLEWGTTVEYSIIPQPGLNTLDFIVRNYAQAGGSTISNPTGLIYKATVTYYLEESAWAAYGEEPGEIPFPGNNWATYFTYFEPISIDSVEVFPDGENHCSLKILETGKKYRLDVSGTYTYWPAQLPGAGIADAKYSLRPQGSFNPGPGPQWISGDDLVGDENYLELWVNGSSQDWIGDYISHIYSMEYDGDGSTVCFSILDSGYGDNSGSLIVEIYQVP